MIVLRTRMRSLVAQWGSLHLKGAHHGNASRQTTSCTVEQSVSGRRRPSSSKKFGRCAFAYICSKVTASLRYSTLASIANCAGVIWSNCGFEIFVMAIASPRERSCSSRRRSGPCNSRSRRPRVKRSMRGSGTHVSSPRTPCSQAADDAIRDPQHGARRAGILCTRGR